MACAYRNGKVVAIIPARGGSKGIPRKNLTLLGGVPLIAWTIRAALEAKSIDRVIVSSEDEEIIQTAQNYGAEVPFRRPDHLATDTAKLDDVVQHVLSELKKESEEYEIYFVLFPTSPFRTPGILDYAVEVCRTKSFSISSGTCENWNPGFWLGYKDNKWSAIKSEQAGLLFKEYGYVNATAAQPVAPKIDNNYRDQIRTTLQVMQNGEARFKCPKELVYLESPAALIDIDTHEQLEQAEQSIKNGLIAWHPAKGYLNEIDFKKEQGSSEPKPRFVQVSSINNPNQFIELELEQISSPFELRKLLDKYTLLKNKDLIITDVNCGERLQVQDKTTPQLSLISDAPRSVGVGKIYYRMHSYYLLIDEKLREELGSGLGDIKTDFKNGAISIELPSSRLEKDELVISVADLSAKYDMLRFRYEQKNSVFTLTPRKRNPLKVEVQIEKDTAHWVLPENSLYCVISWMRPGIAPNGEPEICDPIEIEGFIRRETRPGRWENDITGEIIAGRQQLPDIFQWSGWAFLPRVVNEEASWQVRLDGTKR